jgi:hypothetical protein
MNCIDIWLITFKMCYSGVCYAGYNKLWLTIVITKYKNVISSKDFLANLYSGCCPVTGHEHSSHIVLTTNSLTDISCTDEGIPYQRALLTYCSTYLLGLQVQCLQLQAFWCDSQDGDMKRRGDFHIPSGVEAEAMFWMQVLGGWGEKSKR